MPRIPRVFAQTAPGVLTLPRPTPETFGAAGFRELARFGAHLGAVADRLQAEQDKLDLAEDAGWFEGKVKETKLALSFDPDYQTHAQRFTEAVTGFQQTLAERKRSPAVRRALKAHIARLVPEETVNVQADALKLWTSHQRAALDAAEETLSQQAVEAPSPEKRDEAIALYEGLLAGQASARILTPEQAEQKRQAFATKVSTKQMELLARTNLGELFRLDREGAFARVDPVTREKIIEAAVRRAEHGQAARDRERKARSEEARNVLFDKQLRGDLTLAEVNALGPRELGGDGTLLGEDYRAARELAQKPVTAVGVDDPAVVQAVRRDLILGRATVHGVLRLTGAGLSQRTANDLAAQVKAAQEADHPSKAPEWTFFRQRLVEQVTGRQGIEALLEAKLTDEERARLDLAMDQYWVRTVERREAPRAVYQSLVDDLVGRATTKLPPQDAPRFPDVQTADDALARGLFRSRQEYFDELRRQRQRDERLEAERAAAPPAAKPRR